MWSSVFERVLAFIRRENTVLHVPEAGSQLETGMRFEIDPSQGRGYTVMHRLGNGLEVALIDLFYFEPLQLTQRDVQTYFGFSLLLEGHLEIAVPALTLDRRVAAGELAYRGGNLPEMTKTCPAQTRVRGLSIDIPQAMRDRWQAEAPGGLNASVDAELRGADTPFLRIAPASEAAVQLADKLFTFDTSTTLGRIQYEASVLNLLAHLLDPDSTPAIKLTRAQRRQLNLQRAIDDAIDILQVEWSSPPTIRALARRVGLNKQYLQDGFHALTGSTIGDYVRRQRMERARTLIESRGVSVLEAAQQVGYSNPSHFSQAFRKHFGVSPAACRTK